MAGYVAIAANYFAPEEVLDLIMNSAGCVAVFVYAFIALAQWRLRKRMTAHEKAGLQLKVWLHPVFNIVVLVGITVIIIVMALSPSNAPQVWLSVATLVLLLAVYPIVRRRNRRSDAPAGASPHPESVSPQTDHG